METSFHPSLTLVPSLANYSFPFTLPPHWGVPLSPHLYLHSTFWRSRENISLYRCFCAFARFPYGLQFTGFTYDSSLSNCVIVTYLYMPILYLLEHSDSFTFFSEFRGVGGCTWFTVHRFPLHSLLCFSVMSEIHLIIRGFQSPSAPSPTPASPSQSSSSQGAAAVCRTYSLCLRRRMSIVTFNRLTFLYCVPRLRWCFSSSLRDVQGMSRGGSFCCFTLGIAYRYTIVNSSQRLRLLRLLLLPRLPHSQLRGLMSNFVSTCWLARC